MKLLRLTPEQTEALGRYLARAADVWRQLVEAFRAMARQLTRTVAAVAEFVQRQQAADPLGVATTQRRPAWMSPYGPPGRHRRR
ncbi:hypothetical protein [Streptomyces afghaniensis]|uniref:hypothetical protein n=1 Tax=Streptomyces afghaniensis TaxID=66865 RepID=UPI00277D59FF|nr:hypothetical protein [Streptomyces afghaniensis]MDQ1018823.1 putative membrane chloride channel (bestrophin family) [Streptomyces afghaniensis]